MRFLGSVVIGLCIVWLLSKLSSRINPNRLSLKEEILQVLNHTLWKTTLEIRDEICEKRGVDRFAIFGTPSLGGLYVNLRQLIEEGHIEERIRTNITQAELNLRSGHYPREYKLTVGGIRRRNKIKRQVEGRLPAFKPQEGR